jgi:hypothetical protein
MSSCYRVCDHAQQCGNATVLIINAVNRPPTTRDDCFTVSMTRIAFIPVLLNDDDIDDNLDLFSLCVCGPLPHSGELIGQIDVSLGGFYYRPFLSTNASFDRFTYRICDTREECFMATVDITISINHAPVAIPDFSPPFSFLNSLNRWIHCLFNPSQTGYCCCSLHFSCRVCRNRCLQLLSAGSHLRRDPICQGYR